MSSPSTRPKYTPPLTKYELSTRLVTEMALHNEIYKGVGVEHCHCKDPADPSQQSRMGRHDVT